MRAFVGCLSALFFCGCASLPKNFEASPSYAITQDTSTTLGRSFLPRQDHKSGFLLLNTGEQAFLARIALADTAERTIDAQYFIWKGDASGVILIDRLIKAADRGVRVRLLLDDLTSHGADLGLAALDHHPNIEVRLYNPLGRRYYWSFIRTLSMAFHAGRMTHRMHNKIYVVDNQAAIVGGRNIADEYFGVDKRANFRDMDLLTVGSVSSDISNAFDAYWNSPWAVPLAVFKIRVPNDEKLKKEEVRIEKIFKKKTADFPYPLSFEKEFIKNRITVLKDQIIWAEAEVVSDPPDKAWSRAGKNPGNSAVVARLKKLGEETKSDMLIVSPYLILGPEAINGFGDVVKRNISVRFLTNSLMSTDALPVVAVYRDTRKDILSKGIELHETRPDAASRSLYISPTRPEAHLSLHGKMSVFDRRDVFVGTFNIDPRSEYLNTEVGLIVHSSELAEQVASAIEEDFKSTNSWQLSLSEKNKIIWRGVEKGKQVQFESDPHSGVFHRFAAWFLSLLPIDKQL